MSNWVGYAVSVDCGEPLGCYQGTILEADKTTITLVKAFRNGFPYPKSQVTLNAADIKDLKIIEDCSEPAKPTHSTVAISKSHKKVQKATVCENLQAYPSNSDNQACISCSSSNNKCSSSRAAGVGPAKSKPIDIQTNRNKNNNSGSYGNTGSTPKNRHDRARRRNEACFGELAEPALQDDFDFEGNLALFDKHALWEQWGATRPDVVRHAALALRHDESVLPGAPVARCEVPPPLLDGPGYVTDGGSPVPALCAPARRALWAALGAAGCGLREAATALLARAAADVALRLVGGGRRLDPRNAHQAPAVVALVGAHEGGAAGVLTARLLSAQGARAAAHVSGEGSCSALRRELAALQMATGVGAVTLEQLPSADVVVLALHEPGGGGGGGGPSGYEAALQWVRRARGAVVALEPAGWEEVSARASVVALLPPAACDALGRVYLADVAPPAVLFRDLSIEYRPPFAARAVLALHTADAAEADVGPGLAP